VYDLRDPKSEMPIDLQFLDDQKHATMDMKHNHEQLSLKICFSIFKEKERKKHQKSMKRERKKEEEQQFRWNNTLVVFVVLVELFFDCGFVFDFGGVVVVVVVAVVMFIDCVGGGSISGATVGIDGEKNVGGMIVL
jgi:hypothetical protein